MIMIFCRLSILFAPRHDIEFVGFVDAIGTKKRGGRQARGKHGISIIEILYRRDSRVCM
jgi:hypothetical protein